MSPKKTEFKVSGDELLKKVKSLIKEGNVRRIIIKDKKGSPVTISTMKEVYLFI